MDLKEWEPPENPHLKINFDAMFNAQKRISCSGMVIKNHKGDILKPRMILNNNVLTTFAAEALASTQAIEMGSDLAISNVVIKGDALSMVKKLKSEKEDKFEISAYINDSKKLSTGFSNCIFKHAKKFGNQVAHILPK